MSARAPLLAAFAVLALAATATPAAANRCRGQVIDLGTLPGDARSVGLAVNAGREAVGYSDDLTGHWRAFRWANGRMQALALPGPGNSEAKDINAAGTIVGKMRETENADDERGFAWRDGRVATLPGLVRDGHTEA